MSLDIEIFKKSILWILQETSPENPKELWELIGAIDMNERVLISYEELITTLKTMISQGLINESKPLNFYKTKKVSERGNLSQISEDDYEKAVLKFKEWLKKEWEKEEIYDVEVVRIKWMTDKKINKKMKKTFVEDLKYEVEEPLIYYPREIVGYEKGKNYISFWILSTENIDAHEVYETILPQIKDFIQKQGGTCEIQVGNKGEEKKIHIIKN
jgi:hypothetical protein